VPSAWDAIPDRWLQGGLNDGGNHDMDLNGQRRLQINALTVCLVWDAVLASGARGHDHAASAGGASRRGMSQSSAHGGRVDADPTSSPTTSGAWAAGLPPL